jgi:Ca2+-binding EF-hand superfamily protein
MSGRIIVKKVKSVNSDEMTEMFNQMLGTGSVNLEIAYPRYLRMKSLCSQAVNIFKVLAACSFMRDNSSREEIVNFITSSTEAMRDLFSVDLTDYSNNLSALVDEQTSRRFAEVYDRMKKSDLVNTLIIICDRLVLHKQHLGVEEGTVPNPVFVRQMASVDWRPFPFTSLDIKEIFMMETITPITIDFFMKMISKLYVCTRALFEESQQPDIDIDKFIELIGKSLDEIQKRDELSRCGAAFKKIRESLGMLKDRFGEYYREFVNSGNNTAIMECFINDISHETQASPVLLHQFRTIIQYYTKMSSNIKDPKLRSMLAKINETFAVTSRNTENLVSIKKPNESGPPVREEVATTTPADQPNDGSPRPPEKSIDELISEINNAGKKNKGGSKK